MKRFIAIAAFAIFFGAQACADDDKFSTGPVIKDYGPVANVDDARITPETKLKVAFDFAKAAEPGTSNRYLASAARFLNMHAAAGALPENIEVAVVVHGPAAMDLVTDERYGSPNANADLIAALIDAGVRIELCGQTAAFRDIEPEDLLPGIQISLSAMTAHALLQQDGYTLNPF